MTTIFSLQTVTRFFLPVIILAFSQTLNAQGTTLPDTSKMNYNQVSTALKLYAFPAKGQTQQKQKEDEFECYQWAMQQSGIDPLNLPKVEAAPVEKGPNGAAVAGAAKGAAAGAAIGAITGDAGEGAAIGAVAGGLSGRRARKGAEKQQEQQTKNAVAAKEQELKDSYKKAFSVCMEGKGYTIK